MTVLILEVKAAAEDSEEKEAKAVEKGSNQEMAHENNQLDAHPTATVQRLRSR